MATKLLHLSLDALAEDGFIYSEYDVSGAGHDQYVKPENREAFLDDMAAKFRAQAAKLLEEVEVDWEPDKYLAVG